MNKMVKQVYMKPLEKVDPPKIIPYNLYSLKTHGIIIFQGNKDHQLLKSCVEMHRGIIVLSGKNFGKIYHSEETTYFCYFLRIHD